ncbi:hypothetical protein M409DRAFT_50258 [Zasmidium cellare ATCC 36951]|uniref:F-box domain-containing protein n=1 Tax=Zasmidium cellare ATCC 36951 TaxID=1080233 RepID=A0A6A6CWU2_ZASCE|nr:uncharacterized protein M409DRAFT_50258 [Zasmidium cellare ATCC 36951]KAF2171581.1 hypothetical protein M409DRAFT_50258 [Zasmidium cellare ATCC 36951]
MVTQVALPSEVVLAIVELLDIDTFLGFRLICRSYNNLIDSHMSSLALAVAHNTFPTQKRIFEPNQEDGGRRTHGWHIIAHLGRIVGQANSLAVDDLTTIGRPDRTSTPSEPPWTPDMVEKEGYQFVMQALILDVFGPHHNRASSSADVCRLDCVTWLITRLIQLGPQRFWRQWWKCNQKDAHKSQYDTGDLAYEIDAAWKSADRPLSRWELDGPRLIEHQINSILMQVKSVVAESYSTRLERRLGLLRVQRGYFGGLCLRVKSTPHEKPQIPFVFGSLRISQPLNWQLLAEDAEHPLQISSQERHQRRQETFRRPKEERMLYYISREAMALYSPRLP